MNDPFIIQLDDDLLIDLANLPEKDWDRIKKDVQFFLKTNTTKDIGKAYIAAFWIYLQDIALLAKNYDPEDDISH